jgi:O-antigen/teichoic acid export membrane protein
MAKGKRNFYSPNGQRMISGKMLGANVVYRILNVVVVFSINILLTRAAGAAGYGLLSLLIANATIFNLVSSLGADAGITFNIASGGLGSRKIFRFIAGILFFQLLILLIAELLCWIGTGHLLLFETSEWRYAWIGPIFLVAVSLVEKFTAILYGRKKFSEANKIILATNVFMITLLAILYFMKVEYPVVVYIGIYVMFNFFQAILLLLVANREKFHASESVKVNKGDLRLFFSYSLLAFLSNLIQFFAYRIDYWLVDYYKGLEDLGWYSLAVRLSQLLWVLPILFASIILPAVASDREGYEQMRMHALIRGMNIVNLVVALLAFLLVPYLIPLLFGEEYKESIIPVKILLPGVLLFCIATVLAAWFAGKNMLKVNLAGSILCLLVILSLDLALIPSLGIKGAAIASSTGYGVTGIYFVILYCMISKVPVGRLFIPGANDRQYIRGILDTVFSKK